MSPDPSVLNRRLTIRNLKKQSGNSFAYRPDRNVFDAILKVKGAIRRTRRNFIVQFDFKSYFDSIPHSYLKLLLRSREILTISNVERGAIYSFLTHKFADKENYSKGVFQQRREGTPQGSAISLGLANLANHQLDTELESINGQFARYADDTVVVCYSYEDALQVHRSFVEHCRISGLIINQEKSDGIRVLSDRGEEEIKSISNFKFLGYGISSGGLFMHRQVEERLKKTLSRLINLYLVHYIESHSPNLKRAGVGFDWDLIGLISEVRNILYGGLTERDLERFIKEGDKLPRMKGLMGFYALLDDYQALIRLDGWLVSTIKQALYKRYELMHDKKPALNMPKHGDIVTGDWYLSKIYNTGSFQPDARMPSFVRAWAAARKYYYSFGLENVEPPRYVAYY